MPELDAEHRNQLAEAASGHRFILDRHAYGEEACYCGWKRDGWDSPMHEDHLLDALAPLVAGWMVEAEAAALREAADEAEALRSFAHGKNPISEAHRIGYGTARRVIVRQLRDRADRIGSGDE